MSRIDTVETEVFKFDELTAEAQQTALEKLYNINVDYDWWESVFDDALQIGLKLTGFNIDRGQSIEGDFTENTEEAAALILKNHGETCDTFTLAGDFLENVGALKEDEDALQELTEDFERELKAEYLIILAREYEYMTSEEAIKETIESNDYEFTAEGKLY